MSWEGEVSSVDMPAARAARARQVLLDALASDDVPAAARALFESPEIAGFVSCPVELERLRALPRLGALVGRLERASRAAAQRISVRIATEQDVPCVRSALDAPEDWPDYPVPASYEASPRGIVRLERQGEGVIPVLVSHAPIYVTGIRVDVDTQHEWIELGFRRHGQWRKLLTSRELTGDSRAIVALRGQGVSVNSVTSRGLVSWLDACEAVAPDLPRQACTSRTGWHGDVYVSGPGGELLLQDPEGKRSGWRESGSWDGWLKAVQLVKDEPIPMIALYIGCIAPLMRWLDLDFNPLFDLYGPPNRGKTTSARFAASVYGRPDEKEGGVIKLWSQTINSVEKLAAATADALLILDDHKHVERPEQIPPLLYKLHQGVGKGRLNADLGERPVPTWRCTILSTGEKPVIDDAQGGARARAVSIAADPFAISSLQKATQLEALIRDNHGHLARRIAARAFDLGPKLKGMHRKAADGWADKLPADTRLLYSVAAVSVAATVATEVGVLRPACDWDEALAEILKGSSSAADHSLNALDVVRQELFANRSAYVGQEPTATRDGSPIPQMKVRGVWKDELPYVAILPLVLRDALKERGHEIETVQRLWRDQGVLLCGNDKGRFTKVVRVDGIPEKLYCFAKSKLWAEDPGD